MHCVAALGSWVLPGGHRNGRVEPPTARRRPAGVSSGAITVTTNWKPVIGQWSLHRGGEERRSRTVAFAHHQGSRACGTFHGRGRGCRAEGPPRPGRAPRRGAGARRRLLRLPRSLRPGPVRRSRPDPAPSHGGHWPATPCSRPARAPRKIGFALPWTGVWGSASMFASGIYSFGTAVPASVSARLANVVGPIHHAGPRACSRAGCRRRSPRCRPRRSSEARPRGRTRCGVPKL